MMQMHKNGLKGTNLSESVANGKGQIKKGHNDTMGKWEEMKKDIFVPME